MNNKKKSLTEYPDFLFGHLTSYKTAEYVHQVQEKNMKFNIKITICFFKPNDKLWYARDLTEYHHTYPLVNHVHDVGNNSHNAS